jgi:hypothetical protein
METKNGGKMREMDNTGKTEEDENRLPPPQLCWLTLRPYIPF